MNAAPRKAPCSICEVEQARLERRQPLSLRVSWRRGPERILRLGLRHFFQHQVAQRRSIAAQSRYPLGFERNSEMQACCSLMQLDSSLGLESSSMSMRDRSPRDLSKKLARPRLRPRLLSKERFQSPNWISQRLETRPRPAQQPACNSEVLATTAFQDEGIANPFLNIKPANRTGVQLMESLDQA